MHKFFFFLNFVQNLGFLYKRRGFEDKNPVGSLSLAPPSCHSRLRGNDKTNRLRRAGGKNEITGKQPLFPQSPLSSKGL